MPQRSTLGLPCAGRSTWASRMASVSVLIAIQPGCAFFLENHAICVTRRTSFVRTPKFAIGERPMKLENKQYRARGGWLPYLEIAVGTYFLGMVVFAITTFNFLSIPFLALFVFGYYWAGFTTLYQEHQNRLRWLRARNLELARQA